MYWFCLFFDIYFFISKFIYFCVNLFEKFDLLETITRLYNCSDFQKKKKARGNSIPKIKNQNYIAQNLPGIHWNASKIIDLNKLNIWLIYHHLSYFFYIIIINKTANSFLFFLLFKKRKPPLLKDDRFLISSKAYFVCPRLRSQLSIIDFSCQ